MTMLAPPKKCASSHHINQKAFTLIELLAVIGIFMVLSALLTAAVGKGVVKAKEAGAISNLRSIGVALSGYLSENNGRYPYNAGPQATGLKWTQLVDPYLPDKTVTYENSSGKPITMKSALSCPLLAADGHHDLSDYGVNNEVIIREGNATSQLAAAAVPKPVQTVMAMTAQQSASDGIRGTWYVNTSGYVKGSATTFIPSDRGLRRILCVFVDGHTEAIPRETFELDKKKYLLLNP